MSSKKEYTTYNSDLEDEDLQDDFYGNDDSQVEYARDGTLEATDRALTAAERDQRDALLADEALRAETTEPFDTITYVGRMAITPEALASFKAKDRIEFSAELGNLLVEETQFSNAEDQSEALRAFGACDLVKSIDLQLRHTMEGASFTAEFPTVPLSERERAKDAKVAHVALPVHGLAADEHWERSIAVGTMAYATQYPGHTEATIGRTISAPANGAHSGFKRILASPVKSPAFDYYNALVAQENAALGEAKYKALDASKADELGEVAGIAALVDRAQAAAVAHQREHVPYANATDPTQFRIVLRADSLPRYDAALGKCVPTTANLSQLHIERHKMDKPYLALKAHGVTEKGEKPTRGSTKYQKLIAGSETKPYEMQLVAVVKYRKFAPNFKA